LLDERLRLEGPGTTPPLDPELRDGLLREDDALRELRPRRPTTAPAPRLMRISSIPDERPELRRLERR